MISYQLHFLKINQAYLSPFVLYCRWMVVVDYDRKIRKLYFCILTVLERFNCSSRDFKFENNLFWWSWTLILKNDSFSKRFDYRDFQFEFFFDDFGFSIRIWIFLATAQLCLRSPRVNDHGAFLKFSVQKKIEKVYDRGKTPCTRPGPPCGPATSEAPAALCCTTRGRRSSPTGIRRRPARSAGARLRTAWQSSGFWSRAAWVAGAARAAAAVRAPPAGDVPRGPWTTHGAGCSACRVQ